MMLLRFLLPTRSEISELALRETDPLRVEAFAPIAKGPIVALFLLAYAGVAALVIFPVVFVRRIARSRN